MSPSFAPELILALATFAIATTGSPGPNNLMLLASGANFGFSRTLPHLFGIAVGFAVMLILVGLGLTRLFEAYPLIETALRVVSIGYLLFLAYKIATAAPPQGASREANGEASAPTRSGSRPMTFLQAAAFQWVNPKAWAIALSAIAAYAPDHSVPAILVIAFVFAAITVPVASLWAGIGRALRTFLADRRRLRLFNVTMAALLVLSLVPVVTG